MNLFYFAIVRLEVVQMENNTQGKLLDKADAKIRINKHGNVWISWKNTRRSFRFTVFQDGQMHSGLLGTEAEM